MTTYLKLLLKQAFLAWKPDFGNDKSKARNIAVYASYAVLALLLTVLVVGFEYMLFYALREIGQAEALPAIMMLLCSLCMIFTSFFYVLNTLFFSKDVELVASMPMTSMQVLTAKLLRIAMGEAGIAAVFCVPSFIMYGASVSAGVLYYVKAALLFPLVPIIPLLLITLLSQLLIRVSALWKRREVMTTAISMLLLIAVLYFEMQLSTHADNIDFAVILQSMVTGQGNLFEGLMNAFPPIRLASAALLGADALAWGQWALYAVGNAAAFALVVWLCGRNYLALAVKQNETRAMLNAGSNRKSATGLRSPLSALYRRELKEILTVPVYVTNCFASAIAFPVIAAIMMMNAGQGVGEGMQALMGLFNAFVTKDRVVAGFVLVFIFVGLVNMGGSTAVSREGKRHEFFLSLPVEGAVHMQAKLLLSFTVYCVCALPMLVLFLVLTPLYTSQLILAFVLAIIPSLLICEIGLMQDALHPKYGWKTETEAIKQSANGALAMLYGLLIMAALAGVTWLSMRLGCSLAMAMGIALALAAIGDVWMWRLLRTKVAARYMTV